MNCSPAQESTWDYKALNIPSRIGDYTVTSLTFSLPSEVVTFSPVTISETVTYMEGSLFKRMTISELYYNAEDAETGTEGESTDFLFQRIILELHIGENVKTIPAYCFDGKDSDGRADAGCGEYKPQGFLL